MSTLALVETHPRFSTALALTVACIAFASGAGAGTLLVDRFDDDPAATSCSIITAGDCSLRGAILNANLGSAHDDIYLLPGTYTLTVAGAPEDQAATGDLDILYDVTIYGNVSGESTVDGGGLDRVFDIRDAAVVTMSRVTITGGASPGSTGGGARVGSLADLTLVDATVRNNSAHSGGGLYSYGVLDVTSSTVRNNTAAAVGGGIATSGTLDLDVTNSEIGPGNSAIDGGGIHNGCFHGHLYESSIWGNTVTGDGGGMYNNDGMVVENCTFNINFATSGVGGAIMNNHYLQLKSVTITGNASQGFVGSAIYSTSVGELGLVGTLIQGTCWDDGGSWTSYGGNLESPGNSCSLDHADDQNLVPDPMLGELAHHGGPTSHFALDPGSPAIDAGTNCPVIDQRGTPRPLDGDGDGTDTCDVGAYEVNPNELFIDDFESGDTSRWDSTVGG